MKTTRNTSSGISCKRRWQTGKRTIIGPSGIVLFIMILFWILGGQNSFAQGVGISESSIVPHSSSILELRSTLRGFLAPRMTTSQRVILGSSSPAQGLLVYDTNTRSFWYYDGGWKVVRGSGTLGGSNQLLGMNAAGDENEYKTLNGSINILVTHSTGNINLTTSQDIYPAATPTFAGLKISSLAINSGVYTDGFSFLTTAPPPNGILGYWSRSGNILSPATPGDFVTTSGNIYTTGPGTITSAGLLTGFAGASISGGPINLNNNSSFSTNINTGNSAGAIIIGNPANTITLPAFASAGVVHNAFGGLLSSSLIINPDIANGTIDLLNKVTNTLKVVNGGTGLVTFGGTNTVLYTSATDVLTSVATSTAAGQFLQTSTTGSAPTWKTILDVVNGGTNSGTALNNNRFMISNGGKIEEAGAMLNGQVIVGSTGLAPQIVTMSGEATIDNAGTLALSTTGVAFGTYGDATHVGRFTVDSKGRLTAANDVLITGTSPIGSSLTSANIWVGNTSNQAAEVLMSGDATMTNTGAVTVGRINGATVPVSGALVTGNVLQVIGSNSTTYGPVNIGGGLDYVTGTLPVVNGGTGQSSPLIPGGVLYGSTATAAGVTSAGLTGQMLRSAGSGTPIWSTPTYPNSATFGKIMIGNGTNWLESLTTYPSTTTANQLLYSSANNTITGLATANNGVLVTEGTGAPSISSTLPNAVQGNITSVGTLTNLTVTNIIVGSVTGNAGTATILQTGRAINGVTFNGSADITVPVNSTDDLATVTTVYPLWTTAVGNTAAKLSTSKLSFVPSTGILTATFFAGSGAGLTNIPNTSLSNNSLTIGTTNIALGATSLTLAGLTSVTSTSFTGDLTGNVTGNAGTATILQTGRAINGVTFNGSADITVPVNSTDDLATVTTVYPLWTTAVGNTAAKLSTSKLSFVPSTGILTATGFAGSGAGLTNIPNTSLSNNSLTIGTTNIALGATSITLAGLTSVTSTSFTGALTGNASTATTLATTRAINGVNFDGSAAITVPVNSIDDLLNATPVYPLWTTAAGNTAAKLSTTKLSFVPSTGILTATGFAGSGSGLTSIPNGALSNNSLTIGTTSIALGASSTTLAGLTSVTSTSFTGALTGNAGTATALANARLIYGNSFNGTADLAQVIASTYGGTGNGFTEFSGPNITKKTFILPNADATILTSYAPVTIAQGGTGQTTQQTAINVLAGAVTTGQFLRGDGTNVGMSVIQIADVPILNQSTSGNAATATSATLAINLAGGAAGSIPYQTGAGTTNFLLAGAASQVLAMNAGATAPIWTTRGSGDMVLADAQTVTGQKTFSVAPVFSTLTQGSIPFAGASGLLIQDNSKLFWDNTNKWLGIGTAAPTAPLDVLGDVHISATGSGRSDVGSPNPPRTIGITNWVDGNGARYTFGDAWNALQNAYGDRMQLTAFWGVDIVGNTGIASAKGFVDGAITDASLNVIGTRTAAPVLTVTSAAGQTGNLQEWRNSTGTALVTIGSNGSVRIGNGRFTINKAPAPRTGLDVNTTLTVADVLDAGIIGFTTTGTARTLTFPTAATLVAALPGTPAVGDVFTFLVFNNGTDNVTLVGGGGTNVTIVTNIVSLNRQSRVVYCRVTNATGGSEAISVY